MDAVASGCKGEAAQDGLKDAEVNPPSPFTKIDMESNPDTLRDTLPRLAIPPAGIHPVVAPRTDQEEDEDFGIEPLTMFAPVVAGPPRSSKSVQLSHPVDPKVEEWNNTLPRRRDRSRVNLPRIPRPPTSPGNRNTSSLTFAPHSPESQPAPLLGTWSANLMGDT